MNTRIVRPFLLLFFFFLTPIYFSYSQTLTEKDTLKAWEYYKKADSLIKLRNYIDAIPFYKKALEIYKDKSAWKQVIRCYNNLAIHSFKGDSVQTYTNEALYVYQNLIEDKNGEDANTYFAIGYYNYAIGNLEKALNNFLISKKIDDIYNSLYLYFRTTLYILTSDVYYKFNDYHNALKFAKKRLEINTNKYGANADSHYWLGHIFYKKSEFNIAAAYIKKYLSFNRKYRKNDNFNIGSQILLGHISTKLSNYNEAILYFKKGEEYVKKYFPNRLAEIYNSIANGYREMGLFKESLHYFSLSLSYSKKDSDNPNDYIHANLGKTNIALNKLVLAEKNYLQAIDIHNRFYGKSRPIILADYYSELGKVFHLKKEYKKAIKNYDIGLKLLKNYSKNNYSLISSNYLKLYNLKAQSLKEIYLHNQNFSALKKAYDIYRNIDTILNREDLKRYNFNDKLNFSKTIQNVFSGAIETNLLFHKRLNEKSYLNRVFNYSERNKATVLSQSLSASNSFSGLSDSLVDLERTLKSRRAYYQSQITNELDKKQIDSSALSFHQDKLFLINRHYDSLTEVLKSSYPKYYNLRYNTSVISLEEVQAKLDDKTTLLEFFTADSTTYAFTISKNAFNVLELSTTDLLELVEKQRKALGEKNSALYKKLGRELYNLLVSPLKDKLVGDNLIIVPDGPLWHLNFDLLLTEDINSNNPVDYPYLLKQYAISYANSANLLFNRPDIKKKDVRNEALAFSYSDTTDLVNGEVLRLGAFRDIGEDLPGTRKEIKAISGIVKGAYYYGKEAVEANFKKQAGNYSIVHLALHGEVDNENPQNSRLFFTKSKDSLEDNLLYSHELFALNIPAELTVLSACNTGTGKIAKGEGIMSLGNAFQYAGTKSLLLSSWEVADDTAP